MRLYETYYMNTETGFYVNRDSHETFKEALHGTTLLGTGYQWCIVFIEDDHDHAHTISAYENDATTMKESHVLHVESPPTPEMMVWAMKYA